MRPETLDGGGPAPARAGDDRAARRVAFAAGARSVSVAIVGTVCWGTVTGVALVKGGLSPLQAIGMVMLVYSGTAQLAALPLMSAGASLPAIWATALLANLRFVAYSATVTAEFRALPLRERLLLGWVTTDTGLAAYYGRGGDPGSTEPLRVRAARFAGTSLPVYAAWAAGTVCGVALSGLIPDSPSIAFVGVLAIAALVGPLLSSRATIGSALAASVVALLVHDWPLRLGTFAAIAAGIGTALVLSRPGRDGARA